MEKEFFYGYVDNKIYSIYQDIVNLEDIIYNSNG